MSVYEYITVIGSDGRVKKIGGVKMGNPPEWELYINGMGAHGWKMVGFSVVETAGHYPTTVLYAMFMRENPVESKPST